MTVVIENMAEEGIVERENPYPGQILAQVDFEQSYLNPAKEVDNLDEANVATSLVKGDEPLISEGRTTYRWDMLHKPVIDIDLPIKVLPSTTEGHFHLFIDKEMTWDHYRDFLCALASVGIVEQKYVNATIDRGFSAVRLPWIKKAANSVGSEHAAE